MLFLVRIEYRPLDCYNWVMQSCFLMQEGKEREWKTKRNKHESAIFQL